MQKLMRKVMFALIATALVVTGAQAATIVEQNGFQYDLSGDLQIQLRQDQGNDQEFDVEFDDLEIKNSISYELDNGLSAFGQLDFSFNSAAESDTTVVEVVDDTYLDTLSLNAGALEEAYVGLAYQNYSILMGKTTSAGDDFGVSVAMETYGQDDAFDAYGPVSGDDLIKAAADFDTVSVLAAYEIEAEGENSEDVPFFDILVSTDIAGLEAAVAYRQVDANELATYGISLAYDAEVVWVGADYSVIDYADDAYVYNIAAVVPVAEATTVGAGYNYIDEVGSEVSAYYLNVQHMLHNNVKVFAEIGDTDEDDVDMGYLAGLQVKF
jgi:predicted porin